MVDEMNHLNEYLRREQTKRKIDLWIKRNPILSWNLVIFLALAILAAGMYLKSVIDSFGVGR